VRSLVRVPKCGVRLPGSQRNCQYCFVRVLECLLRVVHCGLPVIHCRVHLARCSRSCPTLLRSCPRLSRSCPRLSRSCRTLPRSCHTLPPFTRWEQRSPFVLRASPVEALPSRKLLPRSCRESGRSPHDSAANAAGLTTERELLRRSPRMLERSPSMLPRSRLTLELSPSMLEVSPFLAKPPCTRQSRSRSLVPNSHSHTLASRHNPPRFPANSRTSLPPLETFLSHATPVHDHRVRRAPRQLFLGDARDAKLTDAGAYDAGESGRRRSAARQCGTARCRRGTWRRFLA